LNHRVGTFEKCSIANKGDVVFFVGSHANKRESGEKNPASHLVAIASIADLKAKSQVPAQWASLDKLFKGGNLLGEVLYKQLQCGGLNIEGATILGEDLLIGIRSPSRGTDGANSAAYVISTPLAGLLDEDFSGARLHALPTDRAFIGIRAMETVGNSVVAITGDAGVSDLKDGAQPECGANLNKEDPDRPFQLRLWKPASGDAFEVEPLITFDKVEGENFEGERSVAKLEAIAADPARPGAFFILYDGSDTVRYVTGIDVEQTAVYQSPIVACTRASAATAAVSARRMRGPSGIAVTKGSARSRRRSSSEKPPSGPISRPSLLSVMARRAGRGLLMAESSSQKISRRCLSHPASSGSSFRTASTSGTARIPHCSAASTALAWSRSMPGLATCVCWVMTGTSRPAPISTAFCTR
jgi:hypothetical protein